MFDNNSVMWESLTQIEINFANIHVYLPLNLSPQSNYSIKSVILSTIEKSIMMDPMWIMTVWNMLKFSRRQSSEDEFNVTILLKISLAPKIMFNINLFLL